jgi:hypothetical protein
MPARRFRSIALLFLALVLVACGGPVGQPDPQPPSGARLYLAVGGGPEAGLYTLNASTGASTRLGAAIPTSSQAPSMGLAPGDAPGDPLLAVHTNSLYAIEPGLQAPTTIAASLGTYGEGLAHDAEAGTLYVSVNGFLVRHRASDGEQLDTLLSPPNQPDIEGLAFDPQERVLYGLARGYPDSHPEAFRSLYALDVEAAEPAWTEVGDTGGHWADAGLAFDPDARVLYAVGRFDDTGGLYRIEPTTGATTRVGATGLAGAFGGLAWR